MELKKSDASTLERLIKIEIGKVARLSKFDLEDTVQEALTQLVEYCSTRELKDDEVRKLAVVIARRRLMDLFRSSALKRLRVNSEVDVDSIRSGLEMGDDISGNVHAVRQLIRISAWLSGLSVENRSNILGLVDDLSAGRPLGVNDRKRLSRLRAELKKIID